MGGWRTRHCHFCGSWAWSVGSLNTFYPNSWPNTLVSIQLAFVNVLILIHLMKIPSYLLWCKWFEAAWWCFSLNGGGHRGGGSAAIELVINSGWSWLYSRVVLITQSSWFKLLPVVFVFLLVYYLRKHLSFWKSEWFRGVSNFLHFESFLMGISMRHFPDIEFAYYAWVISTLHCLYQWTIIRLVQRFGKCHWCWHQYLSKVSHDISQRAPDALWHQLLTKMRPLVCVLPIHFQFFHFKARYKSYPHSWFNLLCSKCPDGGDTKKTCSLITDPKHSTKNSGSSGFIIRQQWFSDSAKNNDQLTLPGSTERRCRCFAIGHFCCWYRPGLNSTQNFDSVSTRRRDGWTVWGQWGLCDTEEDWEGCSSLQPVSTVKQPAHNFWTQVAAHFVTDYPSRGNACKETCCSLTFAGHLSYSFPTDGR